MPQRSLQQLLFWTSKLGHQGTSSQNREPTCKFREENRCFNGEQNNSARWVSVNFLCTSYDSSILKYIMLTMIVRCLSAAMKNCAELFKSGQRITGVYKIDPDSLGAFEVFCDQKSSSGGWTVFQKRLDGSVDFVNRSWADCKRGFGNLNGEFWLGMDKIHRLTKTKSRLRVELEDTQGNTAYAEYDMFSVSSERNKYRLGLRIYTGECS